MFKPSRIAAIVAIAAIPVVVSTSSAADPYSPYTPSTTPVVTNPAPTAPKITAVPSATVLAAVEVAIKKAIKNVQFKDLLNGGKSEKLTIPVPGAGTYTVTILYRLPGKSYQSIAKGVISVKAAGVTAQVALKPNKHGKLLLKKLTKLKKKVIKVHADISYEIGNKTVTTTIVKNIHKS